MPAQKRRSSGQKRPWRAVRDSPTAPPKPPSEPAASPAAGRSPVDSPRCAGRGRI